MAAGENPQSIGEPYSWDENVQPAPDIRRLWKEVANGIDTNQTVVWKNAVESLDSANRYLSTTAEARHFIETYMRQVIGILVEQQPGKIGQHERSCVEESLELSVIIVAEDLRIQQKRKGECQVLDVLSVVFNRKKAYYKGSKGNWNVNHLTGLPEVRLRMIERFRQGGGFVQLAEYLALRISTNIFPPLELLHQILNAVADAIPNRAQNSEPVQGSRAIEDDAIIVTQAAMDYISSFTDESLRKHPHEMINTVRFDLQRIFDRLVSVRRKNTYGFYAFWRELILKLITSKSLPLRLQGWEQLKDLIEASALHRPPPKAFSVKGAGCTFVNGYYSFAGVTTNDGYAQRGVEISYERKIPDAEKDGGGKKLTLFRCTMRSQQKWWFLSEADEEQPGTDRDIDYYQHKSKEHEETEPPPRGWVTCRNAGVDPPPNLEGSGLMVPPGEEYNTLEHQLARWAIENKIVELVLGASLHREVVHRSIPLIEFLGSMCERDAPVRGGASGVGPNAYCLQTSHLLLAWKTCTSKADAAVSEEIYQLLVSILPTLPKALAIPLLQAVEESLTDGKRNYLFEVAEFCGALASVIPPDPKAHGGSPAVLSEEVRTEVLKLLWDVLTHPDASSLKTYDNLKRYVSNELRVEPFGRAHRERFLDSSTQALTANCQTQTGVLDELLALRMVKLTQFVLEACPREQAVKIVTAKRGGLASLIFSELTAYLSRRGAEISLSPMNKRSGLPGGPSKIDIHLALSERLRILRYVYGIAEQVKLSIVQLQHLWKLCSVPADKEELMVFIANASSFGQPTTNRGPNLNEALAVQPANAQGPLNQDDALLAAFSDDVRTSAFLDLFCSTEVNWGELGEGAYQSFQVMFKRLRQSPGTALASSGPSLDALWRICLTAGDETVASQAMKDLLAVYAAMATVNRTHTAWGEGSSSDMQTDDDDDDFGNRVFNCLVGVKRGLDSGDASSERSAERCLRILNSAVGQDGSSGRSVTSSAVLSLSSLDQDGTLADVVGLLPHGMRGQSCYRRITVMAKRASPHVITQGVNQNTASGADRENGTGQRHPSTLPFSMDVHPLETLASVKTKVAEHCRCSISFVKPISASGRLVGAGRASGDSSQMSLSVVPDDSTVDQLGIVNGCEMVFVIADRQGQANTVQSPTKAANRKASVLELSDLFNGRRRTFADKMFQTLLSVLEALPWRSANRKSGGGSDAHRLVWDLLLAMPTNVGISETIRNSAGVVRIEGARPPSEDEVMVDSSDEPWASLLNKESFQRSVYAMQAIDAFLQPAPEILSILPQPKREELDGAMKADAVGFRRGFIESGGFDAVVKFFSSSSTNENDQRQSKNRMGNAAALRVLKCCLFGSSRLAPSQEHPSNSSLDEMGGYLFDSLSGVDGLLRSLTAMVVGDEGISTSTISDVLKFLRLLFVSPKTTQVFVMLRKRMAERFIITLLLWEGGPEISRTSSAVRNASKVRKNTHDLILSIPVLAEHALPWLIGALDSVEVNSDSTAEYFDVLKRLVGTDEDPSRSSVKAKPDQLRALGTAVCKKLVACPRPSNDIALVDFSTGVLCGCLKLLRALIENGGGVALGHGTSLLLENVDVPRWSQLQGPRARGVLGSVSPFPAKPGQEDSVLIDLMGAIFDGYLSPGGSSAVSICCDKESRQLGFDAVAAAARSCSGSDGYKALVSRINGIVESAAPSLRHKWGQFGASDDGHTRSSSVRNTSKYSGLRNQGCTCYMNSFLQQLFMMPELRDSMCAAPLPITLRSSGNNAKGSELLGKKIALQWESGASYHANVEGYNEVTGMHTIRYCPLQIATASSGGHQQSLQEEVSRMAPEFQDEFVLSEGRPGKETGVFELVSKGAGSGESTGEGPQLKAPETPGTQETEDEVSARRLFEEVQRTFIHLDEGSRGRCFDPRSLVEACACLKLEFDVWQQNDASEFAMKLLDRMETALKRWAPTNFRYLEHTFGLKQTKQKICKECGLKTNREENLMSIDCQIRGKTDIHEALDTMCEVEYMEGNNKVFCDRCKKNTDTVLRTAISALPDMLILSLKRFDLDYSTFETVKLNSRCAFGQTLNMRRYTMDGLEATEKGSFSDDNGGPSPMDTSDDGEAPPKNESAPLTDEDCEYQLAGVLVHAGVAQGGHYYSFIKDRSSNNPEEHKWYRFDDEDVTPFDPSQIEVECFGGKVKKETKWPNGQVHTVESEQFANALMLFYEKVKPTERPAEDPDDKEKEQQAKLELEKVKRSSGFDAFEPDVRRSNDTHKWLTFLFDAEFQTFLKGLLGLCRLSRSQRDQMDDKQKSSDGANVSWQGTIVDMLLSFFLDVYLYSAEKGSLEIWVKMLSETLIVDRESAKVFVHKLAQRTKALSSNWLRTYIADCPESESRSAAARIFATAVLACADLPAENAALRRWIHAWSEQLQPYKPKSGAATLPSRPLPTSLEGKWQSLEDVKSIGSGNASSIGIIVSYLTMLIEVAPRTWRYNSELCVLIRELSNGSNELGGVSLRQSLNVTEIPARLICLVVREKAPTMLRVSFPGASVSLEAADTQFRQETNPSAQLISISGNQIMSSNDVNARGSNGTPAPSDFVTLFEALGRIIGMKGLVLATLVMETPDSGRGRHNVVLTEASTGALSTIFREACTPTHPGMGQHDIQVYLHRCGLDSSSVPPQKILDILTKYPTTPSGNGAKGGSYLSLEGFLSYYRDMAQTNEARVRADVHTFGFRPDLSRRSLKARVVVSGGREHLRDTAESVSLDVGDNIEASGAEDMSELAIMGLDVFQLYLCVYSACEPLAEYLLATTAYERDTTPLIVSTLKAIHRAPTAWAGNEVWAAATMVMRVLAAMPDSFRKERISTIMENSRNPLVNDQGLGLLSAAKTCAGSRSTQNYTSDAQYAYERYIDALKELYKLDPVSSWMSEHRALWSWMERDLVNTDDVAMQRRTDYSGRRDGVDDDDDDSRMYDDGQKFRDEKIVVSDAGSDFLNGVYHRNGTFEHAGKYVMAGAWKGNNEEFSLFRCNVSNNTKHWYISIVPSGVQPGTNTDIDFYSAPVSVENPDYPPERGWTTANEGTGPAPVVKVKVGDQDGHVPERGGWNNNNGDNSMEQDRNVVGGRMYT